MTGRTRSLAFHPLRTLRLSTPCGAGSTTFYPLCAYRVHEAPLNTMWDPSIRLIPFPSAIFSLFPSVASILGVLLKLANELGYEYAAESTSVGGTTLVPIKMSPYCPASIDLTCTENVITARASSTAAGDDSCIRRRRALAVR